MRPNVSLKLPAPASRRPDSHPFRQQREDISELRIDVGVGYRVYYAQVGKQQMLATQLRECGANLRGTQIARVTPFVNIHKPARQIDELLLDS